VINKLVSTAKTIKFSSWIFNGRSFIYIYILKIKQAQGLNLAVLHILFSCKKKYIYSVQIFYDQFGLLQQTVLGVPNMI
jgi:hypothetical protein